MSVSLFNKKENIQMLWDVISDEDIFRFVSPDIQSKIYTLFINNIQGFFEVEKSKTNLLVDINKKYILLILNHIKKTYPYQPSKIKIYDETPVKEIITFEEIQNEKKNKFERELSRKQDEFNDFMSIKAPPTPEFNDPKSKIDEPIKEMDKILKEMQAQRKYEVEEINKNHFNAEKPDNWLKSQETSLKTDKFKPDENVIENKNKNNNRFKYLNNLEPFNMEQNNMEQNNMEQNNKKHVSFSNENEIKIFNDIETHMSNPFSSQDLNEDDNNLFSKLKKVEYKVSNHKDKNIDEQTINDTRLEYLERSVNNLNEKMDKILELLHRPK